MSLQCSKQTWVDVTIHFCCHFIGEYCNSSMHIIIVFNDNHKQESFKRKIVRNMQALFPSSIFFQICNRYFQEGNSGSLYFIVESYWVPSSEKHPPYKLFVGHMSHLYKLPCLIFKITDFENIATSTMLLTQ